MSKSLDPTSTALHREKLSLDVLPGAEVPVKATLQDHADARNAARAQASAEGLRQLAADAIRRTHGKLEIAAGIVRRSGSHFGRQLHEGSLRIDELEQLGPATLAELGRMMLLTYGPMATAKTLAVNRLHAAQAALADAIELLEVA